MLASTYPRWAGDPEPGFVHELSRRLVDRFEVHVLAPHAAGASTSEILDGVHVHRYRYAPARWETLVNDGGIAANLRRDRWKLALVPLFLLAQWLWLCGLQLRHRFDVVHAHWLIPQGVFAAALRRLGGPRYIVTAHGADVFALRGARMAALRRLVGAHAARICPVSGALAAQLVREGLPPSRIKVMPMGVDLASRFTPDTTVPRDPERLLFVGRLVPKKGLNHLLSLLPMLRQQRPGLRLSVAGGGPLRAVLEAQSAALGLTGAVEFLGPVMQRDLPDLYRRAGLFVAPFVEAADGDQEGLGLVVLEAAGCGTPALIGRVAASADFEGIPGVRRVPVASAEAFAEAVLAMVEDAALRDAAAATATAEAALRWDWARVTEDYANALQGAVSQAAPARRA